jgi:flagellar biosynthesis protein
VSERIVEVAREHGIPLQKDPGLAAALSTVELDQEIPPQLYKAVAQVLGFILKAAGHLK